VTHDIDEAVRLGDRIAVLSEGAHLEQYAPPADLLREPAGGFVREFVGADRGVMRLGVTPIDPGALHPVSTVDYHESGPAVPVGASMREALGALLDGGTGWVAVRDGNGTTLGVLVPEDITPTGQSGSRER
jgi:osmoprotectant transport system ATP-binding protein